MAEILGHTNLTLELYANHTLIVGSQRNLLSLSYIYLYILLLVPIQNYTNSM